MYSNALILMALSGDHYISLIQDQHRYLLQIKKFEFESPVQDFSWRSNDYVICNLAPSCH